MSARTALAAVVVAVAPAACALLAVPAQVRAATPVGVAAWRADPRHLPDPVSTAPAAVHRFLSAAGPAEQRALAARYPGVLGNLDGAPAPLRYAANRQAMRAAGAPYEGRQGRFLLFDPRGDGRVAQVFGDLRSADRIAVLVPGSGVRGANFWRGVGGNPLHSLAAQAAGLYRAAGAGRRLAVIAWLGYDTPRGVQAAEAREDLARAGAAALDRLVAGLVADRPDATIALLGHSYGSVVIGLAAPRLPRQVTDIAVFGSPGMGVADAARLHTRARIWAGRSRRDWIRWAPGVRILGLGHGARPTGPSFGARVFPTADVTGHDDYLTPGTDSLAALARIAAGGRRP
ncbi:alpha/beta hydrolase family protein [Actinoallomurus sp. NBC_01490]|uniref:alpha/beta hydrolase n=1 Tax=Actinoallomurus sp. NBC_01490 TaxID=2903557 RepID=UPI002E32770F|nr:alpha/beta hydrolase [Actinoallomurus sp. NBC_01490]